MRYCAVGKEIKKKPFEKRGELEIKRSSDSGHFDMQWGYNQYTTVQIYIASMCKVLDAMLSVDYDRTENRKKPQFERHEMDSSPYFNRIQTKRRKLHALAFLSCISNQIRSVHSTTLFRRDYIISLSLSLSLWFCMSFLGLFSDTYALAMIWSSFSLVSGKQQTMGTSASHISSSIA